MNFGDELFKRRCAHLDLQQLPYYLEIQAVSHLRGSLLVNNPNISTAWKKTQPLFYISAGNAKLCDRELACRAKPEGNHSGAAGRDPTPMSPSRTSILKQTPSLTRLPLRCPDPWAPHRAGAELDGDTRGAGRPRGSPKPPARLRRHLAAVAGRCRPVPAGRSVPPGPCPPFAAPSGPLLPPHFASVLTC